MLVSCEVVARPYSPILLWEHRNNVGVSEGKSQMVAKPKTKSMQRVEQHFGKSLEVLIPALFQEYGGDHEAIAEAMGINPNTLYGWRRQFFVVELVPKDGARNGPASS